MSDLTVEQRLTRWALSGDTGTSSETLACAVLGIPDNNRRFGFDVPYDHDDFGRCYRLVQLVPEILTMWDKVVAACPAWGRSLVVGTSSSLATCLTSKFSTPTPVAPCCANCASSTKQGLARLAKALGLNRNLTPNQTV